MKPTRIDVSSEGDYHLERALEIAMVYHNGVSSPGDSIEFFTKVDGVLYFGWHASMAGQNKEGREICQQLPCKMDASALVPIVSLWLKAQMYPKQDGGDGSYSKGWRLRNHWNDKDWNEISISPFYVTFSIEPVWIYYSK